MVMCKGNRHRCEVVLATLLLNWINLLWDEPGVWTDILCMGKRA